VKILSFIGRIIGTITFNRKQLKGIAEKSDATGQAWFIIFLGTIIVAVLQALAYEATGDSQYLGTSGAILSTLLSSGSPTLISILVVTFLFQVLWILFIAFVLSIVGKAFGGKFSTMEVVRIMGFASVLSIFSSIASYIASTPSGVTGLLLLASVFSIWQFCVLIYGYSVGGDIGIIRSLIAVIVAVFVAMILLVVIVTVLFVSLWAVLTTI
jgi:hypothetical protein